MAMASCAYSVVRQHPFISAIVLFFVTPPLFRLIMYIMPLLLSSGACFLAYTLLRPYLSSSEKNVKSHVSSRLRTVSSGEATSWNFWMRGLNNAGKNWLESKLKEEGLSVHDAANRETLLNLVQASFGEIVTPKPNSKELFSVNELALKSRSVPEVKNKKFVETKKFIECNGKESTGRKTENDAKSPRTETKVKSVAFASSASSNSSKQVSRQSSNKEETVSNHVSSHVASPTEDVNSKSVSRHSSFKETSDSKHVRRHSSLKEENGSGKLPNMKQEDDKKQLTDHESQKEENLAIGKTDMKIEEQTQSSQNSPVVVSTNPFDDEPATISEEKTCTKVASVSDISQASTATPPRFALPKPPPSMQSPASKFLEASRRIFHKDDSKSATPKSSSQDAAQTTPSKPQEVTPSKGFALPGVRTPSRKLLDACRRLSTAKEDNKDVPKETPVNKSMIDSSVNVSSSKPEAKAVGVSVRASSRRSPDASNKNPKEDNKSLRKNSLEGSNRCTKEDDKPAESESAVNAESDSKVEELKKNSVRTKRESFASKGSSIFSFK